MTLLFAHTVLFGVSTAFLACSLNNSIDAEESIHYESVKALCYDELFHLLL